ncbi:MAG: MptD family putative ECF transporter S component [Eubacteriales bacterium]|nr:MptD family putative ECF transporter S component [Eubacteriales bacterium]
MKEKMQVKDYITIGVILAIYYIGFNIIAGALVAMSSKFLFIGQGVTSLVLAPLYMLFVAKVRKKWAILIFGTVIVTITWIAMGGAWPTVFGYFGVILAEIVSQSGNYKSFMKNNIGYIFFSFWSIGLVLVYYFMGDKPLRAAGLTAEQINDWMANITPTNLIIVVIITAVCAFIGGFIGKAMLKKHFERAGIA